MPASPLLLVGVALAVGSVPGAASAGQLVVSSTYLRLAEGQGSTTFNVRNTGEHAIHVQLSPYRWRQELRSDQVLDPTADLVLEPTRMSLEPGEIRPVRLAALRPVRNVEGTYRLSIEELPGLEDGQPETGLAGGVGIPVFLAPNREDISGSVAEVVIVDGHLRVTLENDGNTHVRVEELEVVGLRADGFELGRTSIPGSYLLPGAARLVDVPLWDGFCSQPVMDLEISAVTDTDVWTYTLSVPPTFCDR